MNRKNEYKNLEKWRATKRRYQNKYYSKTVNAPNSGKPWTKEEIDLILSKPIPDRELSEKLGRSMKAIIMKRCKETHK